MAEANDIETWKEIPNYETVYSASNLGRIRRDKSSKGTFAGRVLKPAPYGSERAYLGVNLSSEGKCHTWKVAQLVMAAFYGWPKDGNVVNHRDGNKHNDRVSNLEYCSQRENLAHAARTGLYPSGDNHHRQRKSRKLTPEEVKGIRSALDAGKSTRKTAKIYSVSRSTTMRIGRGITYKSV